MSKTHKQGPWGRESEALAELDQENATRQMILDGIGAALARYGAKHFERPTGSYIPRLGRDDGQRAAQFLEQLARDGQFQDVTEDVKECGCAFGACRYFLAELPKGYEGHEAAMLLSELDLDQYGSVRLVQGAHGPELVLPTVPMRPTSELRIIIGHADNPHRPPEHSPALYTWFPGRILPPFQDCAVKLG